MTATSADRLLLAGDMHDLRPTRGYIASMEQADVIVDAIEQIPEPPAWRADEAREYVALCVDCRELPALHHGRCSWCADDKFGHE